MKNPLVCLGLLGCMVMLAGCGLAETGAVAAAQGESAAEQAKQARETQEKVEKQLDAAQQAAADRLTAAEAKTAE